MSEGDACICDRFTSIVRGEGLLCCPICGAAVEGSREAKTRHCMFHGGPDA